MPLTEETTADLKKNIPKEIWAMLQRRDGAAELIQYLPRKFTPARVATNRMVQAGWLSCGHYYRLQNRFDEALAMFVGVYDQLLRYQEAARRWVHKGTPLVWISECHAAMGHPVLAKRFLMLTTCEDARANKGRIPAENTGTYFRMVWFGGVPHAKFNEYASNMWNAYRANPKASLFPEWVLQEVDQDWVTGFPSPQEAQRYFVNTRYVQTLLSQLGAGDGKALERVAHYVLSSVPGFRVQRGQRTGATEYDLFCVVEGTDLDFRSELGRYFLCECKDWRVPVDFGSMAKFAQVLHSTKCRFGILFSRKGITGTGKTKYAERLQLMVAQASGLVIAIVTELDLKRVAKGENFTAILRSQYERIRLDLREPLTTG